MQLWNLFGGFFDLYTVSPPLAYYLLAITVIAGLCMGSFLHCAAWRLTHGEKITHGRSHCPDCGHALGLLDLFPVFSWLFLRGRCRYCMTKIPARYPVSELVCGALYAVVFLRFGFTIDCLEWLIFISLLFVLSLCDLYSFIIPDRFILAGIANYAVFTFYKILALGESPKLLLYGLTGGLSIALPLLLMSLIADRLFRRESMGGGDIKLLFMTGLYFDWKLNFFSLICACLIGIVFAVVWRSSVRPNGSPDADPNAGQTPLVPSDDAEDTEVPGEAFPFGASIAIASVITLLVGQTLLDRYLGLYSF